jgi:RING finger/CHY zinc finger protein 1
MSTEEKRKKIYEINSRNIPQSEKLKLIQAIMNPPKTEEITCNKENKLMFCKHYKRYTYPVFKCCNKVYPCRLCHNEKEDHLTDRHDIDFIKCVYCNCFQKVNRSCQNPDCYKYKVDHKYYCKTCNLWSDNMDPLLVFIDSLLIDKINISVPIYHCNDCGICRLGRRKDYKHCNKCNMCIPAKIYDTHPCILNMKEENCPICLKSLWNTANQTTHILKCGHSIHTSCFVNCINTQNFYCPLCKKSIIDLTQYWNQIDAVMLTQEMPEEFRGWTADIHCNDCEKKSNTKYHFSYHKCQECGGYNTVVDNINKVELGSET